MRGILILLALLNIACIVLNVVTRNYWIIPFNVLAVILCLTADEDEWEGNK